MSISDKPWYTPKRDGTLDEYLEKRRYGIMPQWGVYPLFKGYDFFQRLWDEGYLEPNVSCIRLMWNWGRYDEHFSITEDGHLEGIQLPAHSGRPGKHDPKKVLSRGPCWEAQILNRNPKKRK